MSEKNRTLREHGQRPFLTIGPWSHTSPELALFSHSEVLPWLQMEAAEEIYTACIFAGNFTSLALSSHNWR